MRRGEGDEERRGGLGAKKAVEHSSHPRVAGESGELKNGEWPRGCLAGEGLACLSIISMTAMSSGG